mgnify:FL=1
MQKIDTISSVEGRKLLHAIFRELKFNRQMSAIRILTVLWKICTHELETKKYSNFDVVIQHRLGMIKGTAIWMEEIVNRFYFSSVLSFVYFGAAMLILIIGINRFSESVPREFVLGGVVFETTMLIIMFIIMLFAPNDDSYYDEDNNEKEATEELLLEIGEIGRDLAAVVVQLEKLGDSFQNVNDDQKTLLGELKNIAKNTSDAVSPNPEMLDQMKQTNQALSDFRSTINSFNENLEKLRSEEIKAAVRQELDQIIQNKMNEK